MRFDKFGDDDSEKIDQELQLGGDALEKQTVPETKRDEAVQPGGMAPQDEEFDYHPGETKPKEAVKQEETKQQQQQREEEKAKDKSRDSGSLKNSAKDLAPTESRGEEKASPAPSPPPASPPVEKMPESGSEPKEYLPSAPGSESGHGQSESAVIAPEPQPENTKEVEEPGWREERENMQEEIRLLKENVGYLREENTKITIENYEKVSAAQTEWEKSVSSKIQETARAAREETRARYEAEIARLKSEHDAMMLKLTRDHDSAVAKLRQTAEQRELAAQEKMRKFKLSAEKERMAAEEALKIQHRQEMQLLKIGVERENEGMRTKLQKEFELSRATAQVEQLGAALRLKMEEELRQKQKELDEKLASADSRIRRTELEEARAQALTERLELQKKELVEKDMQLSQQVHEQRQGCDFRIQTAAGQHELWQEAERAGREKLLLLQKDLDIQKAEFDRRDQEWTDQHSQKEMELMLDLKAFETQKEEFRQIMAEHNEYPRREKNVK